jgi:hypothetical protein
VPTPGQFQKELERLSLKPGAAAELVQVIVVRVVIAISQLVPLLEECILERLFAETSTALIQAQYTIFVQGMVVMDQVDVGKPVVQGYEVV